MNYEIDQMIKELVQNTLDTRSFNRIDLSNTYLRGSGIEIGALNRPLWVPKTAHVKYLDRMTVSELRKQYLDVADHITPIDIIDNCEELSTIPDCSQDFVIANHVLEHCPNPIKAVKNMLRVLKNGGILFLTIPDKRYTFDKNRPITTWKHLLQDYKMGPENSKCQHFEEWVKLVENIEDPKNAKEKMESLLSEDCRIHFHVWTQTEVLDFFCKLKKKMKFIFEIEACLKRDMEFILILSKN